MPPEKSSGSTLSIKEQALAGQAPLSKLYNYIQADAAKFRVLPPLAPKDIPADDPRAKRWRVGVVRELDLESFSNSQFYEVPGGRVGVMGLITSGALMTRVHLSDVTLPEGASIFAYALHNPDEFYGPFESHGLKEFWTPPVEGDGIVIEYFIPDSAWKEGARYFRVSGVSHIYRNPNPKLEPIAPDLAGACNLNVTPEWANTAKSVGKLQFTSGSGDFVCTGTLLNTTPVTGTPYLLTANHCFNTQAEAQSLRVFWFYDQAGSLPGPPNVTDGSVLLATGTNSDFSFVRLTGIVPGGVFLSGWDASPPPALGTAVTTIHHPSGDYKRISFGATRSSSCSLFSGLQCIGVQWSSGVTEPGSSGAGLWKGSSTDPRLIGDLSGGASSCATPTGNDQYGRFDVTFPQISSFLTPTLCVTAISPTSQSFTGSGGPSSVTVTANSCNWTATSNAPFITITSGASGNGNGTVSFTVAPNNNSQTRIGSILIGEHTFTVNQASACVFGKSPTSQSFPASGGTNSVEVFNQTGCSWQATSNSSFITITSGSTGTGSGTVTYSVSPNSGPNRIGTMTIAGGNFEVYQHDGCTFLLTPSSANFPGLGGIGTLDISTAPGCIWQAFSYAEFMAITSSKYGTGNGSITYDVLPNGGTARSGKIDIIGQSSIANLTVNQEVGNPIDGAAFFVTKHYEDFLNRSPDASGVTFWTNGLTGCGADRACVDVKRVDTSAAFFLSIEFQNTGYLVERFYKVAFGDGTGVSTSGGAHQLTVPIIRFAEFLQDSQRVGRGVVVLQPFWEELLEDNKHWYALDFVQTSRFMAAFPTTMTPAEFIDKLNQNAGNVLSANERTAAINLFTGTNDTANSNVRAQALRRVAEDTDLYSAEFNRAFVLSQYFGYLRRNPNDAPEATLDYTGYEFWLNKLNQFNGNYINAEMVKAFLTSVEYRARFGP